MSVDGTRDGFGRGLKAIAAQNPDVFAMDCDLGRSTRAYSITEVDAGRFIEMGIAEQDMVSTAAGMAANGKCVFVNSFAVFMTGRAYDQIRQQVALPRLNVKVCGSSAGITQGPDGGTHQSVTDMNLMRGLPNMVVLSPADSGQAEAAVAIAHEHDGPVYIRLSRWETEQLVPSVFELGRLQHITAGDTLCVIATGPILASALYAVNELGKEGIRVALYNAPTIKPLATEDVLAAVDGFAVVVTLEEHSIIGGLGSATAEIIAGNAGGNGPRVVRLGVRDAFGESGTADELLAKHSLDGPGVARSLRAIVAEAGAR